MKISCLFGKEVESVSGRSGYILRVNAIDSDITSFTCVDGDEQEFDIPVKNIKSVKDTITYSYAGKHGGSEKSLTLGKPVFDCDGNYIGKLTDIIIEKYKLTSVFVGNKKFSADDIIYGDAVLIKSSVRFLRSDVKKNGKVIFRRGTPITCEVMEKAQLVGEYVQTNLKTIN